MPSNRAASSKQFLKDLRKESKKKSKSKHSPSVPTNADEYLAAGVDLEEAGEKWRGGDAVKSTRFFMKAVDLYDEALKKFPQSFDLAYNKARVQYELTQHPKLLAQLPGTLTELLTTALQSSRLALGLEQDNADAIFNTAQCLTSLVEAISTDDSSSQNQSEDFKHIEEAIGLFQRCLALQESSYEESQAQMQAHTDVENQSPAKPSGEMDTEMDTEEAKEGVDEERWASIIEPVTVSALLDTLTALLETLTTFCNLITTSQSRPPSQKAFDQLQELSSTLLNTKLPAYLSISSDPVDPSQQVSVFVTRANFLSAMADATFRVGVIDIETYASTIEEAFTYETLTQSLALNPEGLCNKAEALITFNSTIRQLFEFQNDQAILGARWKALTTALQALTAASKFPTAHNLVKIHMARGDVELLRYQLGQSQETPIFYEPAARNAATLLTNAATFYRGAGAIAYADSSGSWTAEELKEPMFKESVVEVMQGKSASLGRDESAERILGDMRDEGLIGDHEGF